MLASCHYRAQNSGNEVALYTNRDFGGAQINKVDI
jgi:hypothetical protein